MTSNLLDLAVTGLIIIQIVAGMRRGFVIGTLDLLCWLVSLALTLYFVAPVSAWVSTSTSLPKGLAGMASALGLMFVALSATAILTNLFFRRAVEPRLHGPTWMVDGVLGAIPGAVNGIVVAALLLEFVTLVPVNSAIDDMVMGSRLARPLTLAALAIGQPFVDLAQGAALDVNGLLLKKFGEAPTRLTLPVTELTVDSAAEQRMLQLVNQERTQRGLVALRMDETLLHVARQHSREMLQQHYFAHDSPDLGSPFERMLAAGIRYRIAGENIALAPNVERAHSGLMNSPEHKENILRPEFRKVGIGVINGGLSGETFTQDFTD
jgi:uncharacterized protein YkwD/uncharacterized membrane protein required for colicin V production